MLNNNKYYVFMTCYDGMRLDEVNERAHQGEFNTYKEAIERVKYLAEHEVEYDEVLYIYHDGELKEAIDF